MFGNIENMIQQAAGGSIDPEKLEQAASEHVNAMDSGDVANEVQTAAQSASASGDQGIAGELSGLLTEHGNSGGVKDAAIAYIKNNPQVLTHFAPPFAQGILNKIV
ncbi:MAG: hypothetical protein ABR508_00535 [Candidatus Baltobacteraceae bacterium]